MKKILFISALCAMFANPLAVQAGESYIGLSAGKAKTSADTTIPGFTTTERKNGTAGQLYVGYDFLKYVGMEVGYANLGKSIDTVVPGNVVTYHFTTYYLAAKGSLPIGEHFSFFAKLGLANNRISGRDDFSGGSVPFDGGYLSPMAGLGAHVYFTKNIGMRLEYQDFGKVNSVDSGGANTDIKGRGRMLSLGVQARF